MRDLIVRRLAGSRPQRADVVRRPGWGDIPAVFGKLLPRRLTPAAVLVPLTERDGELHMLLTERAQHLKHHAGQVSFPGGRIESADGGPRAAALRETEEEVGLPQNAVDVVGYLDNYFTITGYSVTPVVGFFDDTLPLRLDATEVQDAFEVPLAHLFDPANHHRRTKRILGHEVPYFEIPYADRHIWGATAAMIICFYETVIGDRE